MDESHVSSTGQAMASVNWIDGHYQMCRPEYEAILRSVGLQPGWRVLDAGCGSGSFLPLMAELVGPTGHVTALDLAPENVSAVESRVAEQPLTCPVEAKVGTLLSLPFDDNTFDALWCANTTQYLSDEELSQVLAEFRRVVRPGGIVAIKDIDATMMRLGQVAHPLALRSRLAGLDTDDAQAHGTWRGPELWGALRRAGLEEVWLRTTVIERFAPLDAPSQRFAAGAIGAFAGAAARRDLSEGDHAAWAQLRDDATAIVASPDFYTREGNVLAVGRVPAL